MKEIKDLEEIDIEHIDELELIKSSTVKNKDKNE